MKQSSDSSLVFLGDVYLPDVQVIPLHGHIVINHEFVISKPEDKPYLNKVNLLVRENTAVPSFPQATKLYAHLDNNHVMDFGDEALERTVRLLTDEGVYCYGNNLGKQNSIIQTVDGINFCLLGYNMTAPSKTLDPESIISLMKVDIPKAISHGAEKVFITIHFGEENMPRAFPKQEKVARAAIDMGVEMVIGHHTHCVQNVELYKGKYIFYGLGNTYFPELDVQSNYDEKGTAHDRFRIRETKWNTSGLMVSYELLNGSLVIHETTCKNGEFHVGQEISMEMVNRRLRLKGNSTGYLRRAYGFVKNYSFYDGKIFDFAKLTKKIHVKLRYWKKKLRRSI